MKLWQLHEAKYSEPKQKAEFQNLSTEQVLGKFFDLDEEISADMSGSYFYPKNGLYVQDERHGEEVTNVYVQGGKIFTINHENDREWAVNPSKFFIYTTRVLYEP